MFQWECLGPYMTSVSSNSLLSITEPLEPVFLMQHILSMDSSHISLLIKDTPTSLDDHCPLDNSYC